MKKLSVIVPVYNTAPYLRECLDSLVHQTLRDIEFIGVDDGSTDDSPRILDEYAVAEPRLRVIHQKNGGLSAARNAGLAVATGEYVHFMDSDDRLVPETYERLCAFSDSRSLDVLFFSATAFAQSREWTAKARSYQNYYSHSRMPSDGPVQTGAGLVAEMIAANDYVCSACLQLFRREFLEKHHLRFTPGILHEDTEFTFRTALRAEKAALFAQPFYERRVTGNSIMTRPVAFANVYGKFRAYLGMREAYSEFTEGGRAVPALRGEMDAVLNLARENYSDLGIAELEKEGDLPPEFRESFKVEISGPVNAERLAREARAKEAPVKVSVVIPVYNMGRFVGECFDSVLSQTLQEIEVICVDDGSTDDSPSILGRYARQDPRVRVLKQRNQGAAAARNAALDVAHGDFIAFMDPDDWYFTQDALRSLYDTAIEKGMQICGGELVEMLAKGKPRELPKGYSPSYRFAREGRIAFADYQYFGWYTRFIYARRLIQEGNIRFPPLLRYQDPPFMARVMHAAGEFFALKKPVYAVRIDHKVIDWQAGGCRKLLDFMAGNLDLFQFAREHDLMRMYERQKQNFVSTGMLLEVLKASETEDKVQKRLIEILEELGYENCVDLLDLMRRVYRIGMPQPQSAVKRPPPVVRASGPSGWHAKKKFCRILHKILSKIGDGVQCLDDNGVMYTLRRIVCGKGANGL